MNGQHNKKEGILFRHLYLYFGCIMHIALTIFTHYYATYYGGFIIDFLLYL